MTDNKSLTMQPFFSNMLKLSKITVPTLVLLLLTFSCDRIKRKGKQTANNAKEKIVNKKDDLADKIIPRFDSDAPDTKFNKKRFSEFFHFEPTPDVRNIYCYADQMGIDSKFFFSFNCDTTTLNRIINELHLIHRDQPDLFGRGLWQNFPWWDSAKIVTINPFSKKGDHETYWYLWYDSTNKKVYYMDFDM